VHVTGEAALKNSVATRNYAIMFRALISHSHGFALSCGFENDAASTSDIGHEMRSLYP
jgi:hypothetical protein